MIAAAITSKTGKAKLPTHIDIYAEATGLIKDSVILLEQIRTLDKRRLKEKTGHLSPQKMNEVDNAIAVSLNLLGVSHATAPLEHEQRDIAPAAAATLAEDSRAVSDTAGAEGKNKTF